MNNFYDLADENIDLKNDFQLRNLGPKTAIATIGTDVRFDWETDYQLKTYYRDTNAEDYDKTFSSKLLNHKPIYDLVKLLDYHLDFYLTKKNGDKDIFLKHIKYVILIYGKNVKK